MTLHHDEAFGPNSAPTLAQLVQNARVIPIEVEERTSYREPLPSIGDIVSCVPADAEPESEVVPTVPLPLRRRAGGRRRTRALVGWSTGAVALVAGASVAMAAWMTPPRLTETPDVPTLPTSARVSVDTEALSLAVSAEAIRKLRSSQVAIEPAASIPVTWRPRVAPAPAAQDPANPFDQGAARTALDGAAGAAGACRSGDDPSGVARAIVTFAPSGRVTSATVNGPPFAGTATGGCIARALRTATVPVFGGGHVTVAKTVVIY